MKKLLLGLVIGLGFVATGAYALSIFQPVQGGTGISTVPSYGQVLVGNVSGTYTLTATSALGITGGGGSGASTTLLTDLNLFSGASNTIVNLNSVRSTTTAATSTSLFSTLLRATTGYFTSLFLPSLATPAGSLIAVDANGQFIATNTPASGSVSGGTAGMLTSWVNSTTLTSTSGPTFGYFTGTSTATSSLNGALTVGGSGTSTFANGINLTSGCIAYSGTCISLTGGTSNWATTSSDYWISTYEKGYFYSTTSADYWDTTKSRWATTSNTYWLTQQTTSLLTEGTNLYYTLARVLSGLTGQTVNTSVLVATSTATDSTFNRLVAVSATSTNATTTGSQYAASLTVGSLTGLLKATAGIVSTAILGADYVNGSGVSGNCVKWGASNSLGDTGAPCGSGGSASAAGSQTQIQYNGGSNTFSATNTFTFATTSTDNNLILQDPTGSGFAYTSLLSSYSGGLGTSQSLVQGWNGSVLPSVLTQANGSGWGITGNNGSVNQMSLGAGTALTNDFINDGRNFAIGTTTAQAKLTLQGAYGSQNDLLAIATTTNSSGSATSTALAVQASGNVVIGTTTAQKRLTVNLAALTYGNRTIQSSADGIALVGNSATYILRDTGSSNQEMSWNFNGGVGEFGTVNAGNFAIKTNATQRLTVRSDGRIGISSTTPGVDLAIGNSATQYIALATTSTSTFTKAIYAPCFSVDNINCLTSSGGSGASSTLLTDANTFTGSTSINTLTTIRSTSTQATSTNFFSSILTATSGFFTNLFVTGSSTLQDVTMRNATTTNATTTSLSISGGLSFGGVTGTAWSSFCTSITGSADLCDGSDASGGGGGSANATSSYDWVIYPSGSSVAVWRAKTNASAGTFSDFDDAANFIVNAATSSVPAENSIKIGTGVYQVNATTTMDGFGVGFSAAKFYWYGNGTSTMLVVNNNTSAFNMQNRARAHFENIGFNLNGGADAFYASTTQTSPVASIAESEFFGIKAYSSGVNHTGWVFHFKDAFRYHIMDFHAKDVGNCFSDENNYSNAAFINGDGQIDGFNFCELNNPTAGVNNGGRVVSLRGNSGLVNQMVFKNINGITNSNNSTMFYINHASRIVIEDNNSEQFATTTDVINSNNVHMKTSKYITPWTGLANATIVSTDANSYNNTFSLSEAELSAATYIFRDANTIAPTRPNTIQGYNGNQFTLSDNGGSVLWSTTTSTVVRDVFDNLTGNESYLGRVKITGGNIAMDFLNSRTTLLQYANSAYRWLVAGTEVMSLSSTGLLTTVNYQATASSSFQNFTGLKSTTTAATTTNLAVASVVSSLMLTNGQGSVGAYGGVTCTNQFLRALSGAGASTCATVANTDLANSSITINGSSVSLGGSITVSSTTLLANNNTFSGANSFATMLVTGSSTFQNFTGLKSTTTAATTTDFTVTDAPIFSALSGLLKGNGTSPLTVAVNGTDFSLITAKTCTAGDFVNAVTAAGVFTCGTPTGGGGGGSGIGWTWNNINSLRMSTTTDDLLLGGSATSSTAKLEAIDNGLIAWFASTTGATIRPIFTAFRNTTTGVSGIGINASTTEDSLVVNGRSNFDPMLAGCDILGNGTVTTDQLAGQLCDWLALDSITDGGILMGSPSVGIENNMPFYTILRTGDTTSWASNEGVWLKTHRSLPATTTLVVEALLRNPNTNVATTTGTYVFGLGNVGAGSLTTTAAYAAPTDTCSFQASSTANWIAVARKGSTYNAWDNTGVSTSSTQSTFKRFRIQQDLVSGCVFMIDGTVVASEAAATSPVVPMQLVLGLGNNTAGVGTIGTSQNHYFYFAELKMWWGRWQMK